MSIKAVSFDLDDTLWPLLPVILKAEKDTNEWLIDNYPGVEAVSLYTPPSPRDYAASRMPSSA